jgi:hypothetical protein
MNQQAAVAIVKEVSAQGDVFVQRLDKLPDDVKKVEDTDKVVVGHSETGHHHIVTAPGKVERFAGQDPGICYLVAEGIDYLELTHHRGWDTHGGQRLQCNPEGKTIWSFKQQQEFSPAGWQKVCD